MARWWLFAGFPLAGCGRGIDEVAFSPGSIPGTGRVTFGSNLEGEARVQFGLRGEELGLASPTAPAADGSIPLLGLKAGKAYEMQVVIDKGGKEVDSEVIEVTIPPPPAGVPPLLVQSSDPDKMCDPDGYVLFSYIGDDKSGVAIVDGEAHYVWAVAQEDPALQVGRARPGRDGKSILWNDADTNKVDDTATITRQPMDGSEKTVTRTFNGHHDFVELPDGRLGWLGYRFGPQDPPEGPDLGTVEMAWDTIYESEEGLSEVGGETLIFDSETDYPPGIYRIPGDSVRQTPQGPKPAFLPNAYEFGHGNSLVYRESDDSYFMMWRWLDTLIKVDRQDGYQWEMGGQHGNLPGDPDELFVHAHTSDIWDGRMLIFNNRSRNTQSWLVEYSFDDSGYQRTWKYESDAYEALLGDVRRIPVEGCDNLLVSWSNQGRISELTRDGEIVWDATSAIGNVISRVYYLPDLYDFSGAAYP